MLQSHLHPPRRTNLLVWSVPDPSLHNCNADTQAASLNLIRGLRCRWDVTWSDVAVWRLLTAKQIFVPWRLPRVSLRREAPGSNSQKTWMQRLAVTGRVSHAVLHDFESTFIQAVSALAEISSRSLL